MTKKKPPEVARRRFIGYCWKCGNDVETDYCEKCQHYVQPSPHDTKSTDGDGER